MLYKIPLILEPQSEGGFTVTSPILPELVTEGDTIEEVLANIQDALQAVIEAYQDLGRSLTDRLDAKGEPCKAGQQFGNGGFQEAASARLGWVERSETHHAERVVMRC